MINVFYDNDGNITGFSKKLGDEWKDFNHGSISLEQYKEIQKGDWARYKVDVDSKEFKIYSTIEKQDTTDFYKNKLVEIYKDLLNSSNDMYITIKTINNKPHVVIQSTFEEDRRFDIFLTRKNDPNFLYQRFQCETNKEQTYEVDQLDYKKLFAGDFSLYYYKIFKNSGYTVQ